VATTIPVIEPMILAPHMGQLVSENRLLRLDISPWKSLDGRTTRGLPQATTKTSEASEQAALGFREPAS